MCLALTRCLHSFTCSLSKRRRINLIDFPRRLFCFSYSLFRCWRIFCLISFAVCSACICLLPFPFLVQQYQFVCKIMIRASTHLQYVGNHHRVLYSHFYPLLCVIVIRNGTSELLFRKLFESKQWATTLRISQDKRRKEHLGGATTASTAIAVARRSGVMRGKMGKTTLVNSKNVWCFAFLNRFILYHSAKQFRNVANSCTCKHIDAHTQTNSLPTLDA